MLSHCSELSGSYSGPYFAELVSGLDAHPITNIACGSMHSMALNQWGEVFSWGSDNYGQLGHQLGGTLQIVPKLVKSLAPYHIIQIAAGQKHSIALTNGNVTKRRCIFIKNRF